MKNESEHYIETTHVVFLSYHTLSYQYDTEALLSILACNGFMKGHCATVAFGFIQIITHHCKSSTSHQHVSAMRGSFFIKIYTRSGKRERRGGEYWYWISKSTRLQGCLYDTSIPGVALTPTLYFILVFSLPFFFRNKSISGFVFVGQEIIPSPTLRTFSFFSRFMF